MTSRQIVWLHGFLGCPADFDKLCLTLAETGMGGLEQRCLLLPGHGPNPEAVPVDAAGWLEWLDSCLPQEPFMLGGYSMGARLALWQALRGHRKPEALIMLGGNPGLPAEARPGRRQWEATWARRFQMEELETVIQDWYSQPLFAPLIEHLPVEELARGRSRAVGAELSRAMLSFGTGQLDDLWPETGKLSMPVCYIAGVRDESCLAHALKVKSLLPGAFTRKIQGAGHALLLEAPRETAETVTEFMKQIKGEHGQ
jgi:2-succinyl-6-hydroxy-2,4-cyclohexadiene-1-carboxylate synthase